MGVVVACPGCRKQYRLGERPPAVLACRDCGTEMDLAAFRTDEAAPSTCGACGAEVPAESRFCDACGRPLDGAADEARRDPTLRRLASRELGRATRAIAGVRALCVGYVVLHALTVVALLVVRARIVSSGFEVPAGFDAIVGGMGVMVALYAVAFFFVRSQPFVWTLVLAGFQTLNFGLVLVGGAGLLYVVVHGILTLGMWSAVAVTSRVKRLLREYPDLRVALRMTGGERAGRPGRMGTRFADEARAARKRVRVQVAVATGAVALVIGGLLALRSSDEPEVPPPPPPVPGLPAAVAEFEGGWNAGSPSGVRALLADDRRGRQFDAIVARRGWETLPPVGRAQDVQQSGGEGYAAFPMDDGLLRVQFTFLDDRWRVRSIAFPRE
jgi:hypothetical protein